MLRRHPKLLIVAVIVLATAGSFGYFAILPSFTQHRSTIVRDSIAASVEQSVSSAIEQQDAFQGTLRLVPQEIEIASAIAGVPNGSVDVTEAGIEISVGIVHVRAVPVIRDHRLELDDSNLRLHLSGIITSPSGIESGFERGVNDGLAQAGLTPVSLEMEDGSLIIEVSRA